MTTTTQVASDIHGPYVAVPSATTPGRWYRVTCHATPSGEVVWGCAGQGTYARDHGRLSDRHTVPPCRHAREAADLLAGAGIIHPSGPEGWAVSEAVVAAAEAAEARREEAARAEARAILADC